MFDREKTEPQGEKTEPQGDIEFDFFDESPTEEASSTKDGPRRRRRLPTRPPAPPGGPRLYRLGILIAGAIVLAVILILVVNSCRSNQKQSEYEGYIDDVNGVVSDSAQLGKSLNTQLTTPGIKLEDLRGDLEGLRDQQEQILTRTQDLQPPGPLVDQQEALIETMQFRVNGLAGLASALAQVAQTSDPDESGRLLSAQAQRLFASDVIYADSFRAPAQEVLSDEDITDVSVPESTFMSNPELAAPTAWKLLVQRLTQSPESGGLHGNGIQGVRVQPGGQQLSPSEDNTVKAVENLAFQVLIQNSGDSQETQVPVRLVIQQDPVIRKEQVIDLINPGETKTVTFSGFGQLSFSTRTTLKVTVEPVSGEQNTGNNSAQYNVIFTLQ